jgi:hypothetical protein
LAFGSWLKTKAGLSQKPRAYSQKHFFGAPESRNESCLEQFH